MSFRSKKGHDFGDFKLICQLLYAGAHLDSKIKELILRLSLTMNDFRLSTSSSLNDGLTSDELALLKDAASQGDYCHNSKAADFLGEDPVYSTESGRNIRNINSVVYQILGPDQEEQLAVSLKEAAGIVGVHYNTLSKILASLPASSLEANVNNKLVRRVEVFTGS